MTLAQVIELTGPYCAVLLTIIGVPLMVAGLRWLNARAAAIKNDTWRDLAMTAVRAVEQAMGAEPGPAKKTAAVRVLVAAGVPVDVAGTVVEAAVHALHDAATQVLTTAPATVTVTTAPATASPAIETPAGPPSTLSH